MRRLARQQQQHRRQQSRGPGAPAARLRVARLLGRRTETPTPRRSHRPCPKPTTLGWQVQAPRASS
eukprot:5642622-Pyramimonas_sp.AAC.1